MAVGSAKVKMVRRICSILSAIAVSSFQSACVV